MDTFVPQPFPVQYFCFKMATRGIKWIDFPSFGISIYFIFYRFTNAKRTQPLYKNTVQKQTPFIFAKDSIFFLLDVQYQAQGDVVSWTIRLPYISCVLEQTDILTSLLSNDLII